jgi:hypothetical protein
LRQSKSSRSGVRWKPGWTLSSGPTGFTRPGNALRAFRLSSTVHPARPGAQPTAVRAIGAMPIGRRRDALAHELQDRREGHPQAAGLCHCHNASRCAQAAGDATVHAPLVGDIADGVGLCGKRAEGRQALTDPDPDECHGHDHAIALDGVSGMQ